MGKTINSFSKVNDQLNFYTLKHKKNHCPVMKMKNHLLQDLERLIQTQEPNSTQQSE